MTPTTTDDVAAKMQGIITTLKGLVTELTAMFPIPVVKEPVTVGDGSFGEGEFGL